MAETSEAKVLTMRLNELRDHPGSRRASKRIGRGIGSGKGKTSGKGHKGQKARAGGARRVYEGGQMPIYMRLPKRGFKNPSRGSYAEVNLDRLQAAIDGGKLDAKGTVDAAAMIKAGLVRRELHGIRLLARGEIKSALTIEVAGASQAAVAAVEAAGGKVIQRERPLAGEKAEDDPTKGDAAPKSKDDGAEPSDTGTDGVEADAAN